MELFRLLGKILVNNGEANENIDETTKKANEMAKNLGNKFTSAGKTITKVGKALMPFSVAIGGIGIASAKMSMDFEDALAKVSTIADTSQVPMKDMKKAIMDLSNQTGISSAEIADNVYNAISAGQKTGDAVNFVSNATKLAKAGFTDSASALDILTTAMNAYGLEASEVNKVSDLLIMTQNLGKTTVGELAGQMGRVIPTANAYGVQLDQLSTGYALLTANGINTAESTTYINAMLNELGKSGTQVSDVIQNKTGQSFQELMNSGKSLGDVLQIVKDGAEESGLSLGDLFGSSEAAKAALVMLGDGAEEFNGTLAKMNGSVGATDKAFEKMQTKSDKAKKALNKVKNTMLLLGDAIMGTLGPALEWASNKADQLYNWFSHLSTGSQQLIIGIGALLAALGPVLLVVGKLSTGFGTLVTHLPAICAKFAELGGVMGIITNPITIVVAAVTALVATMVHLYNTNEEFRTMVQTAWDEISSKISGVLQALGELISAFIELVKPIWEIWCNQVMTQVQAAFAVIVPIVSGALSIIQSIIQTVTAIIKGDWSGAWEGIKSIFSTVWETIKTIIGNAIGIVKDKISSGLTSAKETVSSIFTSIKSTISEKIEGARDKVKSAIDKIKGFFNFSWSLPTPKVPGFHVSGGKAPWGFMGKGSLPSVSVYWHAKGFVMDAPTLLGYDAATNGMHIGGEAGPEALSPISTLEEYYKKWSSQGNVELINLMKALIDKLPSKDELKDIMVAALSDGSFRVMLDGREVGRIVRQYA